MQRQAPWQADKANDVLEPSKDATEQGHASDVTGATGTTVISEPQTAVEAGETQLGSVTDDVTETKKGKDDMEVEAAEDGQDEGENAETGETGEPGETSEVKPRRRANLRARVLAELAKSSAEEVRQRLEGELLEHDRHIAAAQDRAVEDEKQKLVDEAASEAVEDEKQKLVDEAASEVAAMAKCVEEASRLEAEAIQEVKDIRLKKKDAVKSSALKRKELHSYEDMLVLLDLEKEKCKKRQEAEESLKDEENAKRQKIEELLRVDEENAKRQKIEELLRVVEETKKAQEELKQRAKEARQQMRDLEKESRRSWPAAVLAWGLSAAGKLLRPRTVLPCLKSSEQKKLARCGPRLGPFSRRQAASTKATENKTSTGSKESPEPAEAAVEGVEIVSVKREICATIPSSAASGCFEANELICIEDSQ
eukprot:s3344_g8.t2